jgi:hypothetical protein
VIRVQDEQHVQRAHDLGVHLEGWAAETWNDLPARARAEAIEHFAKMLQAKLERNASAEANDE